MKEQPIEKHIKDYYETQQLSAEKRDALLKMTENTPVFTSHRADLLKRSKSVFETILRQRGLALIAPVLIIFLIAVYILEPQYASTSKLAALASREIALNHNKRLALDYKVQDYTELIDQMTRLGFRPLPPKRVQKAGYTLVGARYCSILGQIACQYKLVGEDGEYYTLYQTELNDELSRLPEREYHVKGVIVQQWQEAGFFFGLAKDFY